MLLKDTPVPAVNFNRAARKILTPALIAFFLIGIFQPLYSLIKILLEGRLFDYNFTYLRAARAFLSGVNFYSFGDINYPPTALFLFVPLSFIPVFWGQILFLTLSVICLFLSIIFLARSLGWKFTTNDIFLIIPLIFLSFPVKWTFGMGQINNLILLLIVLSFYFFQKKKNLLSGISLGLAVAFKIVPGLLLIYFLLKKEFKTVIFTLTTAAISFFLSGILFGFNLVTQYFFKVVPNISFQPNKGIYYNQAFSGFIDRVGVSVNWQPAISIIFALIILLATAFFLHKRKKVDAIGYSVVICTILLINNFSWQHHFVWLVFPFLSTLYCLKQKKAFLVKVFLFASYILVALNIKQPDLLIGNFLGKIALSHVFWGNFLLWAILLYLVWYDIADDKK